VIDLSITRGTTNWQIYGSRKPGNEPYLLTHHINVTYSPNSEEIFRYKYIDITKFDLKSDIQLLSARNINRPDHTINNTKLAEYNSFKSKLNKTMLNQKEQMIKLFCNRLIHCTNNVFSSGFQ
jgi:hypothetical protein